MVLTGVASGVVIVVASFESTACCSPPLEKLMRVGRLLAMVDEFDYVLCVYVFMVACDVPCSGGWWEVEWILGRGVKVLRDSKKILDLFRH